jgi:hypothetical protein
MRDLRIRMGYVWAVWPIDVNTRFDCSTGIRIGWDKNATVSTEVWVGFELAVKG